jgi:hypothetical protein
VSKKESPGFCGDFRLLRAEIVSKLKFTAGSKLFSTMKIEDKEEKEEEEEEEEEEKEVDFDL